MILNDSAMIAAMASSSSSSSAITTSLSSNCSLSTINDIAAELITSNCVTQSQASSMPLSVSNISPPLVSSVTAAAVSGIVSLGSSLGQNESSQSLSVTGHHRQSSAASSPPLPMSLSSMSLSKCPLCCESYVQPKVMLCCFSTFCHSCLEKLIDTPDGGRIKCPSCGHESLLPNNGVNGLLSDYATINMLEQIASMDATMTSANVSCTGCKSKELAAVARCFDCANFLCPNCAMAHQFMHCFEGHRVMTLHNNGGHKNETTQKDFSMDSRTVMCNKHGEELKYYCRTCDVPLCKECCLYDHQKGLHEHEYLSDVSTKHVEQLTRMVDEGRLKMTELNMTLKTLEHVTNRLQMGHSKAQQEIGEAYQFYMSMLEETKNEFLKELDDIFNSRMVSLTLLTSKVEEAVRKTQQISLFMDRARKFSSSTEMLQYKAVIGAKLGAILNFNPDVNIPSNELEFVSNYQAIQVGVRNTFGYIRSSSGDSKQPPISRPNGLSASFHHHSHSNGIDALLSKRFSASQNSTSSNLSHTGNGSGRSLSLTAASLADPINMLYEKWSIGSNSTHSGGHGPGSASPDSSLFTNGAATLAEQFNSLSDPVIDLSTKLLSSSSLLPIKSQIKRQKMIYHCKFGEFGVMEGQFTEPSGVAVNAQNDIIVADTNNHRIQIFDKEGRFKFQFGECGKRDGQLLYPNRVAVVKQSGDIIVTERSPTHQIQIYNQYGQFVRKFGANILQHPRGVTVDIKGRIIVVECKVMRVIIFDQIGNVLQKFGCSKHLEFPNGVVVNDKQEIFISDNRAHCVKVFSYDGAFLRQIGGEGLTNYPIGVCINESGEILVADNHNNFNITIFTQDGILVNALESKVKHAQCFDVALMDDNSVVLASKDYRIYIYRYLQLQSLAAAVAASTLC